MLNQTFFDFLLPQVLNTTLLVTSLSIYSQEKVLLLSGVSVGILIHVFMYATLTRIFIPTMAHIVLSTLIVILSTTIGYNMTRNKKGIAYKLSIVLLLPCFITSQSLNTCLFLIQHHQVNITRCIYIYIYIHRLIVIIGTKDHCFGLYL